MKSHGIREKHGFLATSIVYPNDKNSETEYEYTPLRYASGKGSLLIG